MKGDLSQPKLPKKAPEYLGSIGKALWRYLVPYLNQSEKFIHADQYLVAQYCSTYEIYRKAYEQLQKHGLQQPIYKTTLSPVDGKVKAREFAGYRKNPSYTIMSDSLSKMIQMEKQLGLSPKARSQMAELKVPGTKKKSAADSLKEFFK